jgi:hypothetical protein
LAGIKPFRAAISSRACLGDTSRMTRECQVRICEGLGVKFPGPTRQIRSCRQRDRYDRSVTDSGPPHRGGTTILW